MKTKILIYSFFTLALLITATSVTSYVERDMGNMFDRAKNFVLKLPNGELRDLGDLQFMWNIENLVNDDRCYGCESNGTHFFITGRNLDNPSNPKVYILDFQGNYVDSFDQSASQGWRDLAWDGEYFYAGDNNTWRIDVFTEEGIVVDYISAPVSLCRSIAYDPESNHLWIHSNQETPPRYLYEIDMDGNEINSFQCDRYIGGLAWDNISEDGPFLWCSEFVGVGCIFKQIDPDSGNFTGVQFDAQHPGGTYNWAAGLGFTTKWNTSAGILFGVQQCDEGWPGDQLAGYTICEIGGPMPDLLCNGKISWTGVKPGDTVTGNFTVENVGGNGSLLDWEVKYWPKWEHGSSWTFTPINGSDLSPADEPVTVEVTCVTPNVKNFNKTSTIKVVNLDDPEDLCYINVTLTTPKNKGFILNFYLLTWLFERFPNAFPILRYLLLM